MNLLHLELDNLVLVVAIGVALGENLESLFGFATGNEETGRLVDNTNKDELENRRESLDNGRNAPRPVAFNFESAKCEPCSDNGTDVPQRVVNGSKSSTMLGVAELRNQHRGATLRKRDTETNDETWKLRSVRRSSTLGLVNEKKHTERQ